MNTYPAIIQGGMGAGVSNWRLARAVSRLGQLGVVSGVALDQIFARRLQDGDPGGHMRRGLDRFPFPEMAERIWNAYYIPGGKPANVPYKSLKMLTKDGPRERQELLIAANFVEVFLAREGHNHPVGINYMEKVQIPHLPSLYGALLAGVGYVLMGAGIPLKIPGAIDALTRHDPATYPLSVTGAQEGDDTTLRFAPSDFMECDLPTLARPRFLAIISSNTLAATMLKKANGVVDGFIIEGPTAGGHNAPPRGKLELNQAGEPVYGSRDRVDLEKLRQLGLPFWLAGGYGRPEKLREAQAAGAAGVQVGTVFALCAESGLSESYKRQILEGIAACQARVFTDPVASPTHFPFKIVQVEGSLSEAAVYASRPRACDQGYLHEAYRTPEGTVGYRCAAEPEATYAAKGGKPENAPGRKCLCNALLANIGQPQLRTGGYLEQGLVTAGDDLEAAARFLRAGSLVYTAADVVSRVLAGAAERSPAYRAGSLSQPVAFDGALLPA
ncbi:MAG TPA: nitronate monooxygenase [Bryobacteraceae bacterium]|nr:nitronate monooxygenase [Bryobacteraceae bacterium]